MKEFKVKTVWEYLKKKGFKAKEIQTLLDEDKDQKFRLIDQILASQIGYYCMRRNTVANGCSDTMWSLISDLIAQYNTKFPYDLFIDFNKDTDY